MHQYDFNYDAHSASVKKVQREETVWQGTKKLVGTLVDDVKKAPIRRKALHAIADHALREVYEEQEQAKRDSEAAKNAEKTKKRVAKQEAKAAKEAASKSKLEQVVEEATATA